MFNWLSVRGRLLISFVGVSGFAVLAAAAAIYSFIEVQRVLEEINERRVPTALTAQDLSARVERIVAGTPALLAAIKPEEQFESWSRLSNEVKEIDALLLLLGDLSVDGETLGLFQSVMEPFRNNLLSINSLVGERVTLADRKAILLGRMRKANEKTDALLESWITNASAVIDELGFSTEEGSTTQKELKASVTLLQSLQSVRQWVTEAQESLVEMASAEDGARLDLLMFRAQQSMEVLSTLATEVGAQRSELIFAEIERFREFVADENSMPSLRTRELTLLDSAEHVLDENTRLSRELTRSVESLVQGTRLDISQATVQARALQTRSSISLILVVSLSLVCSVLIVWLYVSRNLIRRLTALSDSMLAIAGGDLRATLPAPHGSDEISRMAEALVVFRDTAVEVEKTNLLEIQEARRRLVDAIESINEGFSLYDADDRLVVSNSTYRKLLYPGIGDVVRQGVSFETIVRTAAERGLINQAVGRVEEFVAERLALHRNPGESHVQRQNDGRWILISERTTDDGSTVAVYADITELKQREEELTEKSNALEQLSNQLAKYLSPQVYDSIFSGRQEVKVKSSRKKLTVFFSDIVGFTETADRLESEDLIQLLNHYLTEMSRIAFDHGATIDKYVGDAILAFFGDPETRGIKEDALACVRMAIVMRKKMSDLGDLWRQSGVEKPLQVRMGIHTGYCTVGNFGSEDRMDYTIIGGAVNTASRLESLAVPGEILISYETYAHVENQILCEARGETEVKGIAYPIATYQVIDSYENLGNQRDHFREDRPNVKLDLNLAAMSAEDRSITASVLQQALDHLSKQDESSRQERMPKTEVITD
jgi:class 3 adenylate cyclase/HAMP domain-containing protein